MHSKECFPGIYSAAHGSLSRSRLSANVGGLFFYCSPLRAISKPHMAETDVHGHRTHPPLASLSPRRAGPECGTEKVQ